MIKAMKIRLLLVFLLVGLVIAADAQQRKPARQKLTPQEQEHLEKIERMVMATEQVMFIDSVVVNKDDILRTLLLSREAGSIRKTADLQRNYDGSDSYGYLNSMGIRKYFSMHQTDSTSTLFSSFYEDGHWTKPAEMSGINAELQFTNINYPFMMGDGQTLYFSAQGEGCLGGYDIFMTTFDREHKRFLHPINIGMPFNSEANDYLYAIDEYNNLGWFVTDRRQPEGKVCVYIFVPNKLRKTYDTDSYTPEELLSFARIDAIRQTWTDNSLLLSARKRLHKRRNEQQAPSTDSDSFFAVTDDIVYRQASQFRCPENAARYQQLQDLLSYQLQLSLTLDKKRNYYDMATSKERSQLYKEIQNEEHQLEVVSHRISELEKTIRNSEIIFLTNK